MPAVGRSAGTVPERIAWAVDLLDVAPDDELLEFGCGPGVAVSLICGRLETGHITAIDRSVTAIERATARNALHVDAGRAVLHQVDLASFDSRGQRFDKAFGVNVNVFWTTSAEAECEVLARVLAPAGVLRLIYGGPGGEQRDVGRHVAAALGGHGMTATVTRSPSGSMTCITARPGR